MSLTAPCPACARANAAHRITCLYCGVRMPNPTAPPVERPPPPDLDELVRSALRGGSVERVRSALLESGRVPERQAPQPRPPAPPAPPGDSRYIADDRPVGARFIAPASLGRDESRPYGSPLTAPPVPPEADFSRMLRLVADASAAFERRDLAGLEPLLDQIVAAVADVRSTLELAPLEVTPLDAALDLAPLDAAPLHTGPPAPRVLVLPPIRFRYALYLDGAEGVADAHAVAEALEVDVATARTVVIGRHTRVALRGGDPSELERRAARIRARTGLAASVIARDAVAALPLADLALGRDPDGRWRLTPEPLWEAEGGPDAAPAGLAVELGGVRLAVPGEVEMRFRHAAEAPSRWERSKRVTERAPNERRTLVLDLHVEDRLVRIVEGLTDLRGLPGYMPGAARQSFKALVDAVSALWPDARLEPRRPCFVAAPGGSGVESGWPAWEEHSRMARLHRWPRRA